MAEKRQEKLFKAIQVKKRLRACAVYDGITASIVSRAVVKKAGKPIAEFDALWIDLKQIGLAHGVHSRGLVDRSECRLLMDELSDLSVKPFLFHYGTIDAPEKFDQIAHDLEKIGVSIVVVDDTDMHPEPLEAALCQAMSSMHGHTMRIAMSVQTNQMETSWLQACYDMGIQFFVLEGDFGTIKNGAHRIKNLLPAASLMAVVDHADHEVELYEEGISILVYRDAIPQAVYQAAEQCAWSILENSSAADTSS